AGFQKQPEVIVSATDIRFQRQQPLMSALRQLITLARHHPRRRRKSGQQHLFAIGSARLRSQNSEVVGYCRKQLALGRRRVEHVDIPRSFQGLSEQPKSSSFVRWAS